MQVYGVSAEEIATDAKLDGAGPVETLLDDATAEWSANAEVSMRCAATVRMEGCSTAQMAARVRACTICAW